MQEFAEEKGYCNYMDTTTTRNDDANVAIENSKYISRAVTSKFNH